MSLQKEKFKQNPDPLVRVADPYRVVANHSTRAPGVVRDTMLSLASHENFEQTIEEIISFPMRIVKTLSCIESLTCMFTHENFRLHGFVMFLLSWPCSWPGHPLKKSNL